MKVVGSDTAFGALHPSVRYLVSEILRFGGLRQVQEMTIEPVLAGHDLVVLAPTAGGKTEAALIPVLSRVLFESLEPVAVLYIAPLRALLNNLYPRVERMCSAVGLSCARWHGDVPAGEKRKIKKEPPHVLLITPESMEVILAVGDAKARALLEKVHVAIVDEVHAFAAGPRGGHLVSLLERVQILGKRHVQRVGLSATVGDPEVLAEWLQGSGGTGTPQVVRPAPMRAEPKVRFLGAEVPATSVRLIKRLGARKKNLVFAGSRGNTEELGAELQKAGVQAFVHHSSVSKDERATTEMVFEEMKEAVIVATSSLELGIDVGDLDQIFQVDSPSTVSSLAQRMGRTGRRPGTAPNMTFLLSGVESLLLSAALTHLFLEERWVEPISPSRRDWIVLVHQILANLLETGGCSESGLVERLRSSPAFSAVTTSEVKALIRHLLETGYVDTGDALLLLGRRTEQEFGRQNFGKMYAVFDAPVQLSVREGNREIGTLEATFALQTLRRGVSFHLAGRAWEVIELDLQRAKVHVRPAAGGKVPYWTGQPVFYGRKVCEAILGLLTSDSRPAGLDPTCSIWLEHARQLYSQLGLGTRTRPLEQRDKDFCWHTFAGGRINNVLGKLAEHVLEVPVSCSNLSVKFRTRDTGLPDALRSALLRWSAGDFPPADSWAGFDTTQTTNVLSRFQGCLPPAVEQEFLQSRLLDLEGAAAWLAEGFEVGSC